MKTSAPDDVTRYKFGRKLSGLPAWNQTPSLERGPHSYSRTRDKSFQPQPDVYTRQQNTPNCKHLKQVRHQNITHIFWPSLTLSTASGPLKTVYQLAFTKHQIPWGTLILILSCTRPASKLFKLHKWKRKPDLPTSFLYRLCSQGCHTSSLH